MGFVVPLRSDHMPKSGPVSRLLRLKADRPRPRKYGGASRIWRYLHIVGRITAEGSVRREERIVICLCVCARRHDKPCLSTEKYFQLHLMSHPPRCELAAQMSDRFHSNEIIISCFQVQKSCHNELTVLDAAQNKYQSDGEESEFPFLVIIHRAQRQAASFINRPLPVRAALRNAAAA